MDYSAIVGAFTGFVDLLVRRPLGTFLAVNLLGVLAAIGLLAYVGLTDPPRVLVLAETIIGHITTPAVVAIIDPPVPPEEEAKRLQESIPREALTCSAIDELGIQLDADRATFWTFSNGSYGLGGVPFNYANVHCPYVREGIAFIPDDFQKIPNSIAAETNSVLFPNFSDTGCGYWRRQDLQSPYLRASMRSLGTAIMLQCGVRDGNGIPIGKIVVGYIADIPTRDIDGALKALAASATAIGRYNTPSIPIDQLNQR